MTLQRKVAPPVAVTDEGKPARSAAVSPVLLAGREKLADFMPGKLDKPGGKGYNIGVAGCHVEYQFFAQARANYVKENKLWRN